MRDVWLTQAARDLRVETESGRHVAELRKKMLIVVEWVSCFPPSESAQRFYRLQDKRTSLPPRFGGLLPSISHRANLNLASISAV